MFATKVFCLTVFALVCTAYAGDVPVLGGAKELTGAEREAAVKRLNTTLAKLATGDGPSYTATKVLKVTTQVVSGSLETFTVELTNDKEAKQCTVKIWSQPWLKENGTNVQIECEGDSEKLDRTW